MVDAGPFARNRRFDRRTFRRRWCNCFARNCSKPLSRQHSTSSGNLRGIIYIEAGTYPITTSGVGSSSNPASQSAIDYGQSVNILGYDSTNGRGNKPSTYPILQSQSGYTGRVYYGRYSSNASYNFGKIAWLELDGNGLPGSNVPVCASPSEAWQCVIKGPKGGDCASGGSYWGCHIDATGMNSYKSALKGSAHYCYVNANAYRTYALFSGSGYNSIFRGGTSSYPVVRLSRHSNLVGCRVYSHSSAADLIYGNLTQHQTVMHNVFVGTGSQTLWSSTPSGLWHGSIFRKNFYFGCTNQGLSGMSGAIVAEEPTLLSQDPFVDAANDDFTFDSTGPDYNTILGGKR